MSLFFVVNQNQLKQEMQALVGEGEIEFIYSTEVHGNEHDI